MKSLILSLLISIIYLPALATDSGTTEYNKGFKYLKEYSKKGSKLSLSHAIDYFKDSAAKNNAEACYALYQIYSLQDVGDISIDHRDVQWIFESDWSDIPHSKWPCREAGFSYLKKAAEAEMTQAVVKLAAGYYHGEWTDFEPNSLESHKSKAYNLCLRLKDSQVPEIESLLGEFYNNGIVVDSDKQIALDWYLKAYSHGAKALAYKIGEIYYDMNDFKSSLKYLSTYFSALEKDKSLNSLFAWEIWKIMRWAEAAAGANDFDYVITIINKFLTPKIEHISGNDIKSWNPKKYEELYEFESLIENYYKENGGASESQILNHIYSIDRNPPAEICHARARSIAQFSQNHSIVDREHHFLKALFWMQKAAPSYNETGKFCIWVGQSFLNEDNTQKAIEWYEKAISYGDTSGYKHLALLYEDNSDKPAELSLSKAFDCWSKLAESNDAYGLYMMGLYYEEGRISDPDFDRAEIFYRKAADQNSGTTSLYAMNNLASCKIQSGNWQEAFIWLNKARDGGLTAACHNLGDLYFHGHGVQQSYERAFELFSEGMSESPACKYRVATMLRQGLGTPIDLNKSNQLLGEAALAGIGKAQYLLATYKYFSDGIEQNFPDAIELFNKALANTFLPIEAKGEIYRNLSAIYRFGRGVDADNVKADEYMKLAAQCGDPDAKKIEDWLNNH